MTADKANLLKLISYVEEIAKQSGNEWIKEELLIKFAKTGISSEISKDPKIDEIYELCIGKVSTEQATGFYKDFSITAIKDQLIADHIEMEGFRRKNNFEKFCLSAYQQVENIINHLADENLSLYVRKHANDITYEFKNKNSGLTEPKKLTDLIFWSRIITPTVLQEKLNKGVSNWSFVEKFHAVSYYYIFNCDIRKNNFDFNRIAWMSIKLTNLRNTVHREGILTKTQEKTVNEVIASKERYFIHFTSFLEEFTQRINDHFKPKGVPIAISIDTKAAQ